MTSKELSRKIFIRVRKVKLLILAVALGLAVLGYLYTKAISPVFTARATLFPLTAAAESSGASSLLSSLMGGAEATKSFSQEASINIVELALSRRTREAVAETKLPQFSNKSIGQLFIEAENEKKGLSLVKIPMPTSDTAIRLIGSSLLKGAIDAKINKNGIFEVQVKSTDKKILSAVTYDLIDKISQFYIDLKIKKAREDYLFTVRKLDSLNAVLRTFDHRAVDMANRTLFVPNNRIEYSIPKENLITDKERVLRHKDVSANNREEALWRLQKAKPIIEILDKPEEPFDVKKPSALLFALVGFMLGLFIGTLIFVSDILYNYINSEINQAVFGDEDDATTLVNEEDLNNDSTSSTATVSKSSTTTTT